MEGVAACFPCLPQESKAAIAKDCLQHQNGHANRNASEPSSSFRDAEEYGQEQALRRQHAEKRCFDGSSEPLPLQKRRAPTGYRLQWTAFASCFPGSRTIGCLTVN
eukprot:EG_transcript_39588